MTQWAIEDGNISEASGTATNILSGLAKAWASITVGGTMAVQDSLNVASVTDVGVGHVRLNFSNAMANGDYSQTAGCQHTGLGGAQIENVVNRATTRTDIQTFKSSVIYDATTVHGQIMGDLA